MASIDLQASVVARLASQAEAEGLTLEAFLERLADSTLVGKPLQLTGEELDRLLDDEASDDSTYQGTYPRAEIYLDHN